MEKTNNKKRYGVLAVVLVALLAAGVGTWAWLQATQSIDNVFTVGSIGAPDKEPDKPDPEKPGGVDPEKPNPNKPGNGAYLFETKWKENSKIVPGSSVDKNPNVGIKQGSDNAYVFIYVKNAMLKDPNQNKANSPYFTLNDNWKPVAVDQVTTNGTDGQYVSGLFMYAKGVESGPAVLDANREGVTEDVYTGELFSKVMFPGTLESEMVSDSKKMTVSAFIFGADQKGDQADAATNAVKQAIAWANDPQGPANK